MGLVGLGIVKMVTIKQEGCDQVDTHPHGGD